MTTCTRLAKKSHQNTSTVEMVPGTYVSFDTAGATIHLKKAFSTKEGIEWFLRVARSGPAKSAGARRATR